MRAGNKKVWKSNNIPRKFPPNFHVQSSELIKNEHLIAGLRRNRFGPISKYQVLVIDETNPAPFVKSQLFDYFKAKSLNLNYWITAEFEDDFFGRDAQIIEFIVGDNHTYGQYLNYGPLPKGRDFHVTLGVISTLNRVSKVWIQIC